MQQDAKPENKTFYLFIMGNPMNSTELAFRHQPFLNCSRPCGEIIVT
jgi:hypothetical protein